MNTGENASQVQYAVLEEMHSGGHSERFIMGYRNEESLRSLIAAPRILALGYPSRDAARLSPEFVIQTLDSLIVAIV